MELCPVPYMKNLYFSVEKLVPEKFLGSGFSDMSFEKKFRGTCPGEKNSVLFKNSIHLPQI